MRCYGYSRAGVVWRVCSTAHSARVEGGGMRVVVVMGVVVVVVVSEGWGERGQTADPTWWKGLGLLASGVAGDGVDHTRPAGWIAPGRVWRVREREVVYC